MKRLIAAALMFSLAGSSSPVFAKDSVVCNSSGKVCVDKSTREKMGTGDPNAHDMIIRGQSTVGARDLYKYEWIVRCKSNIFAADQVRHIRFENGEVAEASPWENANDEYHTFDKETLWLKKAACS